MSIQLPSLEEQIPPKERLNAYLRYMAENNGSDVHFKANSPVFIRVDGRLKPIDPRQILSPEMLEQMVFSTMAERHIKEFRASNECDLSYSLPGVSRFRVNVFRQSDFTGAVFRTIPLKIMSIKELNLPPVIEQLADRPKGLILVTGPTGSGKSTTLAAMIDHINVKRTDHILTIEDPIEFLHRDKNCSVCQREVGQDTKSFDRALRSALREDPDVILVGELRTLETISMAITTAETGHLVFATLHTTGAVPTINRIIDVFPPHQQEQIRVQLSFVLQGVFAQQLLPMASGTGRTLACEVLIANSAVRNLIREQKIEQIATIIQTGGKFGMVTMNQSLVELYKKQKISYQEAINRSTDPEDLKKLLQKSLSVTG